jgi:hypothetical protein
MPNLLAINGIFGSPPHYSCLKAYLKLLSERGKFIKEEMGTNRRSLKKISMKWKGYINGAVDKNPPQHIIWPIPHWEM